jgi:hypothetical protein
MRTRSSSAARRARSRCRWSPTTTGAPGFPNNLSNLPAGFALPTQSIGAVDPDFQIARTWQNNVQIERALGTDYSVQVGYTFSMIRDLPVVTDVNLTNPASTLPDGRPVYSAAVTAATRVDPRFNHIYTLQSPGEGHYNAVSVMLARRLSRGTTFNISYTLAKGEDNAPLSQHFPGTSALGVVSDAFRTDRRTSIATRGRTCSTRATTSTAASSFSRA